MTNLGIIPMANNCKETILGSGTLPFLPPPFLPASNHLRPTKVHGRGMPNFKVPFTCVLAAKMNKPL